MDKTSREMTFEEEAVFYEKEARAEFAKETGNCDRGGVNNILRRGMRIICKARQEIASREVVHGRWEDMWGGKYANPRYRCSVCKAKALYKFERDLLDNWTEKQALTPICPNCGAKMDGGNEYA